MALSLGYGRSMARAVVDWRVRAVAAAITARRASVPRIATAVVSHNVGQRSVAEGKTDYSQEGLGHADGQEGFGKPESHSGSRRSTISERGYRPTTEETCVPRLGWQEAVCKTVVEFVRENRGRVKRSLPIRLQTLRYGVVNSNVPSGSETRS